MNPKEATILNCNFSECLYFLNNLDVKLGNALEQLSIDNQKPEKNSFKLNELQLGTIVKAICCQINLPDIGLLVGKRIRFEFSSVDEITFHHKNLTLKEFLWAFSRYIANLFPQMVIEFFERNLVVGYKIILLPYAETYQRFCTEVIAAMICNFLHFLTGGGVQPEYVCFNHAKPRRDESYREHFHCDLHFDKSHFEFAISNRYADIPVCLARPNTDYCPQNHSIGSLFPLQLYNLSQRIHKMMENNLEKSIPEEVVAKNLRISSRTLRRRLTQLNSSFQKEVDYFRRDLSCNYLLSQDLDITNVALALGFSDSSAFSKAFRRWSGIPPREFKKRFSETT